MTALRTLEERAALCRKMSDRLRKVGSVISAGRLQAQGMECVRSAEVIRGLLEAGRPVDLFEPAADVPPPEGGANGDGDGEGGANGDGDAARHPAEPGAGPVSPEPR